MFGGKYGKGDVRQMYKCTPADGSKPHRFVPALPREPLAESRCLECENPIHAHEGPRRARRFQWPVRTVAGALGKVAAGASYVSASEDVRDVRAVERGTLVGDWVEAYTDDLWNELGPTQWPEFLVTDSKPFKIRDWAQRPVPGKRPRKGAKMPIKVAFTLLVVMGADAPSHPGEKWMWRPVYAHVVPQDSVTWLDWCFVFSQLPGRPRGITSDEDPALFKAVSMWWPTDPALGWTRPDLSLCLFHAKANFRDNAVPASFHRPIGQKSQAIHDTLWPLWENMANGPDEMNAFIDYARSVRRAYAPTEAWLRRSVGGVRKDDHLREQLSRPWPHGPNSNSVAEAELRYIANKWGRGRSTSFRNAERTRRLLKLMVLERRGAYDERRWAAVIDAAFTKRGGLPPAPLRTISDPAGMPSLR